MTGQPEFVELVTVAESGNQTLLLLVKSVLEGAGIPFYAKGEDLQHLFGVGQLALGYNPIVGPVRIQVRQPDAARARKLLLEFLDSAEADSVD